LGAGVIGAGFVLNAFMNANIYYWSGFFAHALHPGGGRENVVCPTFVKYTNSAINSRRITHSHIYELPRIPFAHSVHAKPFSYADIYRVYLRSYAPQYEHASVGAMGVSLTTAPSRVIRRNRFDPMRTTAQRTRGPDRTTRSSFSGLLFI